VLHGRDVLLGGDGQLGLEVGLRLGQHRRRETVLAIFTRAPGERDDGVVFRRRARRVAALAFTSSEKVWKIFSETPTENATGFAKSSVTCAPPPSLRAISASSRSRWFSQSHRAVDVASPEEAVLLG
jgi:hypothetical protein